MSLDKRSATLLVTLLLSASVALIAEGNSDRNNQFDFALVGDVPYAPTTTLGSIKVQSYPAPDYDALIADINAHNKVLFSVHMGDIKAGDTYCVGGNPAKDP